MRAGKACRIYFIAVMLLVAALLAAPGCSGDEPGGDTAADGGEVEGADRKTGDDRSPSVPPRLVLRGLNGETVSMAEFEGKLVVLNVWATWNNDSRELIEIMNALYPRFSKHFRFLSVSMDKGGAAVVRAFMQEHPVSGDVFVNGEEVIRALGGIGTVPATIMVYEDGRIIRKLEGLYDRKQYEKAFAGILQYRIVNRRAR